MEKQVVLVDENDRETGVASKTEAHQKGLLHRAFSIFIFNSQGEMLLQKRAFDKYHSGGLWTNACCSHPGPNEATADAAKRRLAEELGITADLEKLFSFTYKTEFSNGLTEFEYDHVFAGEYEGELSIDRSEIADCRFQDMPGLQKDLDAYPEQYSSWFRLAFPGVMDWWRDRYGETGNKE